MIKELKDLQGLLKLCRKQGVTEIEWGDIKLKLGDLPPEERRAAADDTDPVNPYKNFPDRILTEEELAFYSSGGMPEEAKQ